eukprot:1157664-Pelagomonas_calceolata.AAC.10
MGGNEEEEQNAQEEQMSLHVRLVTKDARDRETTVTLPQKVGCIWNLPPASCGHRLGAGGWHA